MGEFSFRSIVAVLQCRQPSDMNTRLTEIRLCLWTEILPQPLSIIGCLQATRLVEELFQVSYESSH